MCIPYPGFSSSLAKISHLYLLFKNDINNKKLYWFKIQTFKTVLLSKISNFLVLRQNDYPFLKNDSILDLSKVFVVNNKDIKCWDNLLKVKNVKVPNLNNISLTDIEENVLNFESLLSLNKELIKNN